MRRMMLAAAAALTAGCVTPQIREGKLERPPQEVDLAAKVIQPGKTTKKEVLDAFGPPDTVMKGGDVPSAHAADIWIYKNVQSSQYGSNVSLLVAGGSSTTTLTQKAFLIIYFDGDDRVKEYTAKKIEPQAQQQPQK